MTEFYIDGRRNAAGRKRSQASSVTGALLLQPLQRRLATVRKPRQLGQTPRANLEKSRRGRTAASRGATKALRSVCSKLVIRTYCEKMRLLLSKRISLPDERHQPEA
jgi:hypothetical protein